MNFELIKRKEAYAVIVEAAEKLPQLKGLTATKFDVYDVMEALEVVINNKAIFHACGFVIQELMNVDIPLVQLTTAEKVETCCPNCDRKGYLVKGLEGYQVRCECGNRTVVLKDKNLVQKAWSFQNDLIVKYLRKSRLSLAK